MECRAYKIAIFQTQVCNNNLICHRYHKWAVSINITQMTFSTSNCNNNFILKLHFNKWIKWFLNQIFVSSFWFLINKISIKISLLIINNLWIIKVCHLRLNMLRISHNINRCNSDKVYKIYLSNNLCQCNSSKLFNKQVGMFSHSK